MEEQQRLEIRKEIQNYLEEETKKNDERRLAEEEKLNKILPFTMALSVIFAALLVNMTVKDSLTYFMYFGTSFLVASAGCYCIVRTKLHPQTKRFLLVIPGFVYLLGTFLPSLLIQYGFI